MLDRWLERVLAALGIIMFVAVVFHVYSTKSAEAGAAKAEARIAKARADSARADATAAKAEVVTLKVELVEAKRAATSTDRRASLTAQAYRGIRDTVQITDTAAVRAVLAAADSAVNEAERSRELFRLAVASADSVIAAQERQIGALERENAALRRQVSATERQIPGRFGKMLTAAKWVAVGAGVGTLLAR